MNRLAYDVEIVAKDSALAVSTGLQVLENINKGTAELQKVEASNTSIAEAANLLIAGSQVKFDDVVDSTISKTLFDSIVSKGDSLKRIGQELGDLQNKINNVSSQLELLKDDTLRMNLTRQSPKQENIILDGQSADNTDHPLLKIDTLNKQLNSLKSKQLGEQSRYDNLKAKLDAEKESIYASFVLKKADYFKLFSEFKSLYQDFSKITEYHHILTQAIDDPYATYLDFKTFGSENGLDTVKMGLKRIRKQMNHLSELTQQLNSSYYEIRSIPLSRYFKSNKAELEMLEVNIRHKIVENIAKVVQNQSLDKQATSMLHTISLLEREDTYIVTSTPIQPTQDLAEFSISITQKNGDNKVKNGRSFKHREFTRGGIRLDAGIGIATTYLPNAPLYDLVSDGNEYKIAVNQKYQFGPSVVLLGTATIRNTRSVAFGGSAGVGVGVNTNGESLLTLNNYYLGFTAMFGKTNRFALTSGINLKEVDRLRAGYAAGKTVADKDIVYTRTGYKTGPFFSVTYNLTQGVKDNIQYVKSFLK